MTFILSVELYILFSDVSWNHSISLVLLMLTMTDTINVIGKEMIVNVEAELSVVQTVSINDLLLST